MKIFFTAPLIIIIYISRVFVETQFVNDVEKHSDFFFRGRKKNAFIDLFTKAEYIQMLMTAKAMHAR